MKLIKLTQGKFAMVDDWNYSWLNQWKWMAAKSKGGNCYAVRDIWDKDIKSTHRILMHRLIMGTPVELKVDHIDHNGLNCLEENMRNCTRAQNSRNRIAHGKSIYLGVSYDNRDKIKDVRAIINVNNKPIGLGYFKTEEEAAHAYDEAAKKYFGEFANLNFK